MFVVQLLGWQESLSGSLGTSCLRDGWISVERQQERKREREWESEVGGREVAKGFKDAVCARAMT